MSKQPDKRPDIIAALPIADFFESFFERAFGSDGGRPREFTPGRENGKRRSGRPRGYALWRPQRKTQIVLGWVQEVLDEYAAHLPLTIRQIFYRLVGAFAYPKDEKDYKRLCEYLNRARRAKLIDFDDIRDDGVSVLASRFYDNPERFWDDAVRRAKSYRRNRQQGQRHYVELWCEAAGMMPQLERVADDFSVPVYSSGGFVSASAVWEMREHALKQNRPTVILHVGDFDPSGASIFTAMSEDAGAFVEADRVIATQRIIPVRVALTGAQILQHKLPTAPPKPKKDGSGDYADSRAKNWMKTPEARMVGGTVQAEALPPDVLADIVRDAIEEWFDLDRMKQEIETEQRDRTQLLRALPRGGEREGD
jgi:hypothetical protein